VKTGKKGKRENGIMKSSKWTKYGVVKDSLKKTGKKELHFSGNKARVINAEVQEPGEGRHIIVPVPDTTSKGINTRTHLANGRVSVLKKGKNRRGTF